MINGKNVYNEKFTTELVQQFIDKLLLLHSLSTYKQKKLFLKEISILSFLQK